LGGQATDAFELFNSQQEFADEANADLRQLLLADSDSFDTTPIQFGHTLFLLGNDHIHLVDLKSYTTEIR